MTVAAHIGDPQSLLLDILLLIAEQQPNDRFLVFCSEKKAGLPENIIPVIIPPKPKSRLPLFYWYRYKLPTLLKKYNATVFISDSGMLSLRSDIPQYLFFADTDFKKITGYWSRIFLAGLIKADAIFTVEDFISERLRKFKISPEKIKTVYRGISEINGNISPILLKDKFTGGLDYFIFPLNEESAKHTVTVLKAFSQLKKWQKTAMKLVLLNETSLDEPVPDFKNYKHRDDVKIISAKEKNADSLISNAFAAIFFSGYNAVLYAFHAMMNKVPLIAEENEINKSLFGNAVLYSETTAAALAERMQLLYKDESYKRTLTDQGSLSVMKYDAGKAADLISGAINNKRVIPLIKTATE